MPMQALVLEVDAAAAERLSNALLATGALVIDIADAAAGTAAERPLFAAAAPTRTLWSRQRLKALFAENADVPARLAQALPGKTFVLVTHRNSMLSLVDRLIVLDGGKVVADGPKAGVLDALMKGRQI